MSKHRGDFPFSHVVLTTLGTDRPGPSVRRPATYFDAAEKGSLAPNHRASVALPSVSATREGTDASAVHGSTAFDSMHWLGDRAVDVVGDLGSECDRRVAGEAEVESGVDARVRDLRDGR